MDKDIDEIIQRIPDSHSSDWYLFSAEINYDTADAFIQIITEKLTHNDNCMLILTTRGGDPDAGYRIVRAIKRYYKKFALYSFGYCKSTGTIIALAADEIIMSDFGEFGPLDIQLAKEDELSNTSGLSYLQSLTSLNDLIFASFEKAFINLKSKSRHTITTKTAAEIASKIAIGLIAPISSHIDPLKLGEVQRAIAIAQDYGDRICKKRNLVSKLIAGYPSHGFVIDYEEAKSIFGNVRWRSNVEKELEKELFVLVRDEPENAIIMELELTPEIKETTTGDVTENGTNLAVESTLVDSKNSNGKENGKHKK